MRSCILHDNETWLVTKENKLPLVSTDMEWLDGYVFGLTKIAFLWAVTIQVKMVRLQTCRAKDGDDLWVKGHVVLDEEEGVIPGLLYNWENLEGRKILSKVMFAFWARLCPVWAREHCRMSPTHFLADCCNRRRIQGSFVLLCLALFDFSGLCLVPLSSVSVF